MTATASDIDLYQRGVATLLASWEAYASGSAGAALWRLDGVAVAVFPNGPERSVYNNALFERDLGPAEQAVAVAAMAATYESAGIDRYAVWVHESDEGMRAELSSRGYEIAESTLAMGMSLAGQTFAQPEAELVPLDWDEYLDYLWTAGVPTGLLSGADPRSFHALGVYGGGTTLATAIGFDHNGDCGIYNASTRETSRGQGLATALTVGLVRDAAARGCATASLQSTATAERIYARVGFRDLGRFLEFVP